VATQARRQGAPAREPAGRPGGERASASPWPWLVATVSLVAAVAARSSLVLTVDTYYDLYAGRYIVGHGLPRANTITVAAHGAPWIDQQWLAHVLFYASWAAGGYPAVAALAVTTTAVGFGVLAVAMRRDGAAPSRAFAWTAAAFMVAAGSYQIQAQDFGYLLFAVTLLLVRADSKQPRLAGRTWLAVGVLAAWANLHGSVLLGAALAACYAGYRAVRAAAARDRRGSAAYLGFGAAAIAAAACTPYGTGVIGYYRRFAGNPELSAYIARWAPPDPHDPATWIFAAVVLAVAVAVALAWKRGARPDPFLTMITAAVLALALRAAGDECWFAMAGCLLAADAQARVRGPAPAAISRAFSGAVAGLLAALAAVSLVALTLTPASAFESLAPRRAIGQAAAIARRNPALHLLGDAYTSTAMLWLRPVTIGRDGFDARLELYPAAPLGAWFDFVLARGPRWRRVIRGYDVIVVSRQSVPLARELARLPGWRIADEDGDGLVLVRLSRPRAQR